MKNFKIQFYQNRDPRDLPAYSVVEAAKYLRVPEFMLHSWVRPINIPTPDNYVIKPLIERPRNSSMLTFMNLVEGHVIKALRTQHNVPIKEIGAAINYAEAKLGISRLLISPDLMAGARQIFVQKYGQLISVGRGGQLAIEKMLDVYLKRIEYRDKLPIKLRPFINGHNGEHIAITPDIAFGKPIVAPENITTYMIAERYELGENKSDIALDYGLPDVAVEEAIIYEAAA